MHEEAEPGSGNSPAVISLAQTWREVRIPILRYSSFAERRVHSFWSLLSNRHGCHVMFSAHETSYLYEEGVNPGWQISSGMLAKGLKCVIHKIPGILGINEKCQIDVSHVEWTPLLCKYVSPLLRELPSREKGETCLTPPAAGGSRGRNPIVQTMKAKAWSQRKDKDNRMTRESYLHWGELVLLNCGVGEDSWESLGLQGDPTSSF